MVLGAKLRTIMSSIIRWRKGETLRAAKMEQLTAGVVLMRSNNNEKPPSRREEGSELPESEIHEREWSSQPAPAKRVSTITHNAPKNRSPPREPGSSTGPAVAEAVVVTSPHGRITNTPRGLNLESWRLSPWTQEPSSSRKTPEDYISFHLASRRMAGDLVGGQFWDMPCSTSGLHQQARRCIHHSNLCASKMENGLREIPHESLSRVTHRLHRDVHSLGARTDDFWLDCGLGSPILPPRLCPVRP